MNKRKFLQNLPWLDLQPADKILRNLQRNLTHTDYAAYDYCCIHGASGSGKTKMMLELGRRLSAEEEIFFVLIEGSEKVLDYCCQALNKGLRQRDLFLEDPLAIIKEFFKEEKKVAIFIDRAEALTPNELGTLLELKEKANQEKTGLFLYLFLDINQPNQELKSLTHYATHYTLSPINTDQLKRFVNHLRVVCGYDVKALTHLEINRLHALSYGYPGRVLKLIPPPSNPFFIWRFLTRKKIMLTIISLSLFIILLAGLIIKKEQAINRTMEEPLRADEALVLEKKSTHQEEPLSPQVEDTIILEESLESLSQTKERLSRLPEKSLELPAQKEDNKNVSPLFPVIQIEALKEQSSWVTAENSNQEVSKRETTDKEEAQNQGLLSLQDESNLDLASRLANNNEVSNQLSDKPSDKSREEPQLALHSLKSTQKDEEKDSLNMVETSRVPSGFYIQVFSASTEQQVKESLQRMNIPGTPLIIKDGQYWVAIIGPYSNQKEAQIGLKNLPPSLRALNLSILHSGRFNGS